MFFCKQKGGPDPLIIIYTIDESGFEQQGLAYSIDGGETYLQYEKNPIIANPDIRDFRDPNVIWYNNQYYVLVLAAGDRVQFYNSTNLIDWEFMSEFGNNPGQGERRGVWECPSIFELDVEPINGEPQKSKWILYVSLNLDNDPGKRGSVTQYFVGHFNGKEFINSNSNNTILWADYGPDNYAGIPLSENLNSKETILISWMSNWMYGSFTPTDQWRGQITLPRKAGIERVQNDYYLTQMPIDRIYKQRDYQNAFMMKTPFTFGELALYKVKDFAPALSKFNLFNIEIKFEIDGKFQSGEFGIRIRNDINEFIRLGYNITTNTYYFDRRNSGASIHENFLRQTENERISDKSRAFEWTLIVDTSTVEFFADNGLNVFSGLFYPTNYFNQIEVYGFKLEADENEKLSQLKISSLTIHPLNTIWK